MVYAVQGTFGFRNQARRDTVMQNAATRIAQEVTWGEVATVPFTNMNDDPAFTLEVRFEQEQARDSFWTDVIQFLGTGVNGPVTGSFIQQHDCPHDQAGPQPCAVSERVDYQ